MALTPIDVQQKTFIKSVRGYEMEEVDDFLDEVVTSLKDYEQRLQDAQQRIGSLESRLTDRQDSEAVISRALVQAQRSADAVLDEARAEADRIRRQADEEAAKVLEGAKNKASDMLSERDEETARLKDHIRRLRAGITALNDRVGGLSKALAENLEDMGKALDDASDNADKFGTPGGSSFSLPTEDLELLREAQKDATALAAEPRKIEPEAEVTADSKVDSKAEKVDATKDDRGSRPWESD